MTIIDMNRIREALPKHAKVYLRHNTKPPTSVYLECFVRFPSLSEQDFEMCKQWQREIIGSENISEFYTQTEGNHWLVYFKRVALNFINTTDEDIKTYSGIDVSDIKK